MRKMSIPSIGALFYAHSAAIPVETKTSLLCRSYVAIVVESGGSVPLIITYGYALQVYHS